MSSPLCINQEYRGLPPPPGRLIPTPAELVQICTSHYPRGYNRGLEYPPEAPIFRIKHGHNITWNELPAQEMAHRELQRLGSPVRAPAVYYACQLKIPEWPWKETSYDIRWYIVMEYVSGKTAEKCLDEAHDDETRGLIYSRIALALSEMLRIPVSEGQPPAGIDGGRIWSIFFEDWYATNDYKTVGELEDHINQWLAMVRKKSTPQIQITQEPMVYCYSDLWLGNFIIDGDDKSITVVDFGTVSFLPLSFFIYALKTRAAELKRDISELVKLPKFSGQVNNTPALISAGNALIMGSSPFIKLGYRLLGRPSVKTPHWRAVVDAQGNPVTIPHTGKPPRAESASPEPEQSSLVPIHPPGYEEYLKQCREFSKE